MKKRDHVSPLLRQLHWLPLKERITYKVCLLCHKCINKNAPSYLQELVNVYVPQRSLRSRSQCLLEIPASRGSARLAGRSFTHAGPEVWNSLPLDLRLKTSESEFKVCLKTHLFRAALID